MPDVAGLTVKQAEMALAEARNRERERRVIIAGRLPRRSTLSCHTVPRRAASC